VRAFLGFEIGFAINPVLAGPDVPPLRLDRQANPPSRLGWNSWIPAPESLPLGLSRTDAADAAFEAEIIEAEEFARRGHH
jgi:type VI secretion system protein ImpH